MYDDTPGEFVWSRLQYTAPWDMNRAPTLTLPNGWSEQGLPMALQLVGPLGSEAGALPGRLRGTNRQPTSCATPSSDARAARG